MRAVEHKRKGVAKRVGIFGGSQKKKKNVSEFVKRIVIVSPKESAADRDDNITRLIIMRRSYYR